MSNQINTGINRAAQNQKRFIKPKPVPGKYYQVRKGDNLESISRRAFDSPSHVQDIIAANPGVLDSKRPNYLPQKKIKIPVLTNQSITSGPAPKEASPGYIAPPVDQHSIPVRSASIKDLRSFADKPTAGKWYKARSGDSLSALSKRVYEDYNYMRIVNANKKIGNIIPPPYKLSIDQEIFFPATAKVGQNKQFSPADKQPLKKDPEVKENPQPSIPEQSPKPKSTGGKKYIVRRGDNLELLAKRFLKNKALYPLIMKANQLKSTVIRIKQELEIPGLEFSDQPEMGQWYAVGDEGISLKELAKQALGSESNAGLIRLANKDYRLPLRKRNGILQISNTAVFIPDLEITEQPVPSKWVRISDSLRTPTQIAAYAYNDRYNTKPILQALSKNGINKQSQLKPGTLVLVPELSVAKEPAAGKYYLVKAGDGSPRDLARKVYGDSEKAGDIEMGPQGYAVGSKIYLPQHRYLSELDADVSSQGSYLKGPLTQRVVEQVYGDPKLINLVQQINRNVIPHQKQGYVYLPHIEIKDYLESGAYCRVPQTVSFSQLAQTLYGDAELGAYLEKQNQRRGLLLDQNVAHTNDVVFLPEINLSEKPRSGQWYQLGPEDTFESVAQTVYQNKQQGVALAQYQQMMGIDPQKTEDLSGRVIFLPAADKLRFSGLTTASTDISVYFQALLDTIAEFEGTLYDTGYYMVVNDDEKRPSMNTLEKHPRIYRTAYGNSTSAAGRYQIVYRTYKGILDKKEAAALLAERRAIRLDAEVAKAGHHNRETKLAKAQNAHRNARALRSELEVLKNGFYPQTQDQLAMVLVKQCGITERQLKGSRKQLYSALFKSGLPGTWSSFPAHGKRDGHYNQVVHKKGEDKYQKIMDAYYKHLKRLQGNLA